MGLWSIFKRKTTGDSKQNEKDNARNVDSVDYVEQKGELSENNAAETDISGISLAQYEREIQDKRLSRKLKKAQVRKDKKTQNDGQSQGRKIKDVKSQPTKIPVTSEEQFSEDNLDLAAESREETPMTDEEKIEKLIACSRDENIDGMRQLLASGVDVNGQNFIGENALMEAISHGKLAALELLIKFNADLEVEISRYGGKPLTKAIDNGDKQAVAILIEAGADVNASDTIVKTACGKGDAAIVRRLIEADVNLSPEVKAYDTTPLLLAITNNHEEVALLLIENGADVNQCESSGFSPIKKAAEKRYPKIIRALIDADASYDPENEVIKEAMRPMEEQTPTLELVLTLITKRDAEALAKVLPKISDLNREGDGYETPLERAISRCYADIVTLLINHGADVNYHQNLSGRNSLQNLVFSWNRGKKPREEQLTIAKTLAENGVDMAHKDNYGKTVQTYVAEGNITELKDIINHITAE